MMKSEVEHSLESQKKLLLVEFEEHKDSEYYFKLSELNMFFGFSCRKALHKLFEEKKIRYVDTGDFKTSGYTLVTYYVPKLRQGSLGQRIMSILEYGPKSRRQIYNELGDDILKTTVRARLYELINAQYVDRIIGRVHTFQLKEKKF